MLTDTPLGRLSRAAVAAVAGERRHVRLPRRARPFSLPAEAPRRAAAVILTGVAPRP
ncbi:hypothetical protein [Miltoncostaea marina]|uniref:hypothetical protein n=1 Tax=Miltoncostaea marina TaxID=2843215 RepID=UPI001C3D49E7|nr:hypothetical protein [Miltoncostaea marina]